MALTAAEAFRDAACGRVVTMLASKNDAPEVVVRRLTTALDAPEMVEKPVVRADTCLAMICIGALLALAIRHVCSRAADAEEYSDSEDEDGEHEDGDDDDVQMRQ